MADEIRLWSDELAREPSSLIFLKLGEALRRQGQVEVAFKIAVRGLERHAQNSDAHDLVARIAVDRRDFERAALEWQAVLRIVPEHLGAMKGLGFLSFHDGRFADAERYLNGAVAVGAGPEVTNALETVRRTSSAMPANTIVGPPAAPRYATRLTQDVKDPQYLFVDVLVDSGQTAILLDESGYVMAGVYLDHEARNISQEVGAQLSGISEEVRRSARHLDIGDWRTITFETHAAVVAMAPGAANTVIVVAASRATPLGLLRRLLDQCTERATHWLSRRAPQ